MGPPVKKKTVIYTGAIVCLRTVIVRMFMPADSFVENICGLMQETA